jgi:hypothetical protein
MTIDISTIGREGFVIYKDGKYYAIPQTQWQRAENEVPKDSVGRAAVLVDRGSIVAYVPPEAAVPVGAYCVVVNLSSLVPPVPTDKK